MVGHKIGQALGDVLEVRIPRDNSQGGSYIRMKFNMEIYSPLKRGIKTCLGGTDPFWVEFRYEKIPSFCGYCGIIGHGTDNCIMKKKDEIQGIG